MKRSVAYLPFLAIVLATCGIAWLAGRDSGPSARLRRTPSSRRARRSRR
ncbi:hypothetical protein [Nonomuraea sp. NPDC048916]